MIYVLLYLPNFYNVTDLLVYSVDRAALVGIFTVASALFYPILGN